MEKTRLQRGPSMFMTAPVAPELRWIHHPYVVNSLLGIGLVAIVWLVTANWHCAAAGAICYVVAAYTWFQGKAELS